MDKHNNLSECRLLPDVKLESGKFISPPGEWSRNMIRMIDIYLEYDAISKAIAQHKNSIGVKIGDLMKTNMPGYKIIDEATGKIFSPRELLLDEVIDGQQ